MREYVQVPLLLDDRRHSLKWQLVWSPELEKRSEKICTFQKGFLVYLGAKKIAGKTEPERVFILYRPKVSWLLSFSVVGVGVVVVVSLSRRYSFSSSHFTTSSPQTIKNQLNFGVKVSFRAENVDDRVVCWSSFLEYNLALRVSSIFNIRTYINESDKT